VSRLALVCGGRDYADGEALYAALDRLAPALVVHGGADGADWLAGEWCDARGVPCVVVPALWTTHGRAGGPRRNEVMLEIASHLASMRQDPMRLGVVAFPGGRGTAHMVGLAEKAGVPVWRP
jgi:hypothetical protein